jgi:hypothetical protein
MSISYMSVWLLVSTTIARGMIVVDEGAEAGTEVGTTVVEGMTGGGRRGVAEL